MALLTAAFSRLTIVSIVDILAVALLIYNFILVLRGRRAMHVLGGVGVLALVYAASIEFNLQLLRWVLAGLAPYTAFALIVMFQAEVRRLLARFGRFSWQGLGGQLERREVADEIVLAVEHMTVDKVGALIVLEREIGLRTFVESGVALDALVSADLLRSIFHPKGALHDGAVIVQGNRVAAAACFLPLSGTPHQSNRWGTRHLAALGVSEDSDAIAVAVSEETGSISVAANGRLNADVPIEHLRTMLIQYDAGRGPRVESAPEPQMRKAQS
jgi:diadenylate cyclase